MSSIDKISSLITALARSDQATEKSSSGQSNVLGKTASASFDSVSFNPGVFKQAFSDSYIRISTAVGTVRIADDTLDRLLDITGEMLKIAHRAAGASVSDSERAKMETRFQKLIHEFKAEVDKAGTTGIDFLDKGDLADALERAGIELNAATQVSQLFKKIAGSDQKLGRRTTTVEDVVVDGGTQTTSSTTTTTETLPGASSGAFGPETVISTAAAPSLAEFVTSGDINGDGQSDVFFTSTAGSAGVLLGNGDGTFKSATSVAVSYGASNAPVYLVDLNNDGNLDYVYESSLTDRTISVGLGNGDGTFKAETSSYLVGVGGQIQSLAFGDYNLDGKTDVAATDVAGTKVEINLGNGDGRLRSGATLAPTTGSAFGVAKGDFTEDGVLDLVVLGSLGEAQVYEGAGDGTFTSAGTIAVNGGGRSIQVADLNSDGFLDFAHWTSDQVAVSLGNGDGSFKAEALYDVGTSAFPVDNLRLGDVDGDGLKDIITADGTDNTISVLQNNGDGTFKARITYATADNPQSLALDFFTADGTLDIARGGTATQAIGLLVGNSGDLTAKPDGTFATSVIASGVGNVYEVALADFDEDGNNDLISVGYNSILRMQLGNGDGTFQVGSNIVNSSSHLASAFTYGDFNNDGHLDIIHDYTPSGSDSLLLLGNGNGTFKSSLSFSTRTSQEYKAVDINNDGNLDIVSAAGSNNAFDVYLGNGDGTFEAVSTYTTASFVTDIEVIDLNDDGRKDVIAQLSDNRIAVSFANADGTFGAVISYIANSSSGGRTLSAGDVDGDGDIDIVSAAESGAGTTLLLGNADGSFGAYSVIDSDTSATADISLADIDGDSYLDIVRSGDGELRIFAGNGNGTFSAVRTVYSSEITNNGFSLGDANNDGLDDIVMAHGGAGKISLFLANADYGEFQSSRNIGSSLGDVDEIISGDFNNDGIEDLVSTGTGGGKLRFMLGNGDGTYRAAQQLAFAGNAIEKGDFDKDGNLDLIFTRYATNQTEYLRGNGDGTFAAGIVINTRDALAHQIADVNADGNLDVISAAFNDNAFDVVLGNGDGTFKAAVTYTTAYQTRDVELADVNNDGKLDVISAQYRGYATVALGVGDGTFGAGTTFLANSGIAANGQDITTGDVNNDGKIDVIHSAHGTGFGAAVVLGNGDGTFGAVTAIATDNPSLKDSLSLLDVNGDGNLDLLRSANGYLNVYHGNGDGSFGAAVTYYTGQSASSGIAITDANRDGALDVVLGTASAGTIELFTANSREQGVYGTGYLIEGGSLSSHSGSSAAVSADFNSDGLLDLVSRNSTTGDLRISLGNSDGSFSAASAIEASSAGASSNNEVRAADVNGDAIIDLITVDGANNAVTVLFGNNDGTFKGPATYLAGTAGAAHEMKIQLADFNGDGSIDIAAVDTTNFNYDILINNGNGTFKARTSYAIGATNLSGLDVGDFNADGQTDLVLTSMTSGISILSGNGNGTFGYTTFISNGANLKDVAVGDFNGDGKDDIAATDSTTDQLNVYLGNGNGTFEARATYASGNASTAPTVLDINEDGRDDILVLNQDAAGSSHRYSILIANANGTFGTRTNFGVGAVASASGIAAAIGDFNQDSVIDVAIAGDKVLFGESITTQKTPKGTFSSNISFSADGSNPRVSDVTFADLDRDGDADLISGEQNANGSIWVQFSNGDGTFTSGVSLDFTTALDLKFTTTADLNNDGFLDIAAKSFYQGTTMVYLNNGDGTFAAGITSATGNNSAFTDLQFVDFNNDNRLDLLAPTNGGGFGLALGNGNGSFAAITTLEPFYFAEARGADIDGDGNQDIVAISETYDHVSIYFGNGNGTFEAPISLAAVDPHGLLVTDVTGDNIADLVIAHDTDSAVSIWRGNGDGTFHITKTYSVADVSALNSEIRYADMDGDGNEDLIVGGSSSYISILDGNGDGSFANYRTELIYSTTGRFDVGDYNRDGVLDLVGADNTFSRIRIRAGEAATPVVGSGEFEFGNQIKVGTGIELRGLESGDLNGDGIVDLVVGDSANSAFYTMFGRGDGTFYSPTSYDSWLGSTDIGGIDLADLNNDGRLDFIAPDGFLWNAATALGNSDGSFGSFVVSGNIENAFYAKTADFNNDGILDIVASTEGVTSFVGINIGNGDGSFNNRMVIPHSFGAGSDVGGSFDFGDFNRDGNLDIISIFDAGGGVGSIDLAYGNGDGTFNAPVSYTGTGTVAGTEAAAQVGDFDGDGYLDFAAGSFDYSGIKIWFGTSTGTLGRTQIVSAAYETATMKTADIDGDGDLDFVSTDSNANRLWITKNNGNGTFAASTSYSIGISDPYSLEIEDFNGDGLKDIAVGNRTDGTVSIMFQKAAGPSYGNGTFRPELSSYTGPSAFGQSVTLADINSDNILDAVQTSALYGATPNGSFKAAVSYTAGLGGFDVQGADFNRDGIIDLVSADKTDGTVSLLLGNGNGTFKSRISLTMGTGPRAVQLGDFDSDGFQDIAVANDAAGSSALTIRYGNGDGTFSADVSFGYGVVGAGTDLSYVDLDGDFVNEMIYSDFSNQVIQIFHGNSGGSFAAPTSLAVGGAAYPHEIFDFNGDGKDDIAAVDSTNDKVVLFLGHGDGTFDAGVSYTAYSNFNNISSGYLNSDGYRDIVVANEGDDYATVLLGNGDGSFGAPTSYYVNTTNWDVAISDVSGDGFVDLVSTNEAGNTISINLGNGDGSFKAVTSYAVGGGPRAVSLLDINGDLVNDFVTADYVGGTVSVMLANSNGSAGIVVASLGNGDGSFKSAVSYDAGTFGSDVSIKDLNGDGALDVVTNGSFIGSVVLGNADGSFKAANTFVLGGQSSRIGVYDFDRDGNLDVVANNFSGPTFSVALGNSNGSFKAAVTYQTNSTGSPGATYDAIAADFTGDGILDLVISTAVTTSIANLHVGNGDGTFKAAVTIPTVGGIANGSELATSDINNDGKVDLITYTPLHGTFSTIGINLSNGDGTFKSVITVDAPDNLTDVQLADLNGDGFVDLSYLTYTSDGSGVMLGNGDGTFKAPTSYAGNSAGTAFALGDLNGDGILDSVSQNISSSLNVRLGSSNLGSAAIPKIARQVGTGSSTASTTTITETANVQTTSTEFAQGGTLYDALKTLSVKTRARAIIAEKTLKQIKEDLLSDKRYLTGVEGELTQALRFAVAGSQAVTDFSSGGSAEEFARSLADRVRQNGIGQEQQQLDTLLVQKLLG